jgi:hypothetical protein
LGVVTVYIDWREFEHAKTLIPEQLNGCEVKYKEGQYDGPICIALLLYSIAEVVDDNTGAPITGAYFRSETLDGQIYSEVQEGSDQIAYTVLSRNSVITEQANEPGPVDFRVVVAKEGYTTLVQELTTGVDDCGFFDLGEWDREFHLVEGPPGDDDVYRKVTFPVGTTLPMAKSPRPIAGHTATLLQDGKVVVAGGSSNLNTVELYDPTTNIWTAQSGLLLARRSHGAVLLDDGRVLVAGGWDPFRAESLASSELIGPSGESLGPGQEMASTYSPNTLTPLNDGRVLVVGSETRSTELYNPTNNEWSLAGNMSVVRSSHTATLLSDGRVLAVGGVGRDWRIASNSAELFDPALDLWSKTGSMKEPRSEHTATLLADGGVLAVGGRIGGPKILRTSEIYDTAAGVWIPAASLDKARYDHTATLLLDGRVLVAGGWTIAEGQTREAEIYDPSTGTWSPAAQMREARREHTATRLLDGRVLVVGGTRGWGLYASAEIYDPVKDSWD